MANLYCACYGTLCTATACYGMLRRSLCSCSWRAVQCLLLCMLRHSLCSCSCCTSSRKAPPSKVLRDQRYCADPILVRWTKIRTACQPQSSCRAADGTSLSNAQNTYASNKDCVSAAPQLMALASRFLILTQVGQGKLDNIDFFRFCCSPRVFCFVVQYGICSLFGFRKNHKTA